MFDIRTSVRGRQARIVGLLTCRPSRNLSVTIGDVLYVAEQGTAQVFAIKSDGSRTLVHTQRPQRLVDAAFQHYLEAEVVKSLEGGENVELQLNQLFGEIGDPFPYTWDIMLPDHTGKLWLR